MLCMPGVRQAQPDLLATFPGADERSDVVRTDHLAITHLPARKPQGLGVVRPSTTLPQAVSALAHLG